MRIGYENSIIEDQLEASAHTNLNYVISNVLTQGMDKKYKSISNGSLLITMRGTSTVGTETITYDSGTKVVATDPQAEDIFGDGVAIDGDYMIAGASGEDGGGGDPNALEGAAYIYHRTGDNTWDSGVKIVASDGDAGDRFGYRVGISGDYAVVGSYKENTGGTEAGAAYIFHRTGTNTWDAGTKIVASDAQADDQFGKSVGISGDYVIVGAHGEDGGGGDPKVGAGAAYIFHRTGTNTWDAGTKIVSSDLAAADDFGIAVDADGDYFLVGAGDQGVSSVGASYIFHRTGTTTWDTGTKIVPSDGQANDTFGAYVSIDEDYCVIGAINGDTGGVTTGAAYVFNQTGGVGGNTWDTGFKITPSDPVVNLFFYNVAISGDYIAVGAFPRNGTGGVYTYQRIGTNTWGSENIIVSSDIQAGDNFGLAVSIDGDYFAVGAPYEDEEDTNAGATYIFKQTATVNPQKINASMCVINAHNMASGDSAVLKGYTNYDDTTELVSYTFTYEEYGMAVIFDEAELFWEIELTVTDPVEIGGIFLGLHLITPAYAIGAKTTYVVTDKFTKSKSGQLYGDEGYWARRATYLFPSITEVEKNDWLQFWKAVGTIIPFYLLQYPDRQDIQPIFYCHFTSKQFPLEEHEGNRSVYKDVPVSIEEVF